MSPLDPQRPLGQVRSIRVRLALLVGLSVLAAAYVVLLGRVAGVPLWLTVPVVAAVALLVTQWLSGGLTTPLREMAYAVRRMSEGDWEAPVTTTGRDEIGQLARAFTTMRSDLAAADRQRRELVATVSHELRTPLTAQRALLENLADGVTPPSPEALAAALAQSERLSSLVADLLDLSRVDGGQVPLRLTEVRVADLLASAVAEARLPGPPVELVVDVVPDDLTVTADPDRLAQVVANLLDNAVRHSPAGGRVLVTAWREAPAVGRWRLEVLDEGPGIPAARRGEIFRRFGTTDSGGGGTGLGLSIAAWVAGLHGGTVTAAEPPVGTSGARLVVTLPLAPPARPTPGPGRPPQGETMTAVPAPTPAPVVPAPVVPTGPSHPFAGAAWPERDPRPQPRLLWLSLGVGLLGAVLLPYRGIGVATYLVLLAAGGVVWSASHRRRTPWVLASASLAVALGLLTVLRADEPVGVLGVAAAAALTAVAATDAHRLLGMVASGAAWVLSGVRGLPLLGRTLTALSRRGVWPVVRTVALSLLALVVFGGLFASADAVLGAWAQRLVPDLGWDSIVLRAFVFVFVGGVTLAGAYLALNPPAVDVTLPRRPARNRWEWAAPLGVVLAMFALFLAAQGTTLFGGHDYVRRATGLTYAEYVHRGFGQLTVATALTLVVVALVRRRVDRDRPGDARLGDVLTAVLCLLTLLVVASALWRMALYQQAYGFTVLRVFVDGFELWLGLLVLATLLSALRPRLGRGLPRFALVSGAVFTLGYGLLDPVGFVAGQNIARYHETGRLDLAYLGSLGPDAMPVVAASDLGVDEKSCIRAWARHPAADDVLGWNLGRERGRAALASLPVSGAACPSLLGEHP